MNFDRNKYFPSQEKKNEGATSRQGDRNETELDLSPIPCLPNISSYPNARFPGSTPARSRDMPLIVTPESGESFDSSGSGVFSSPTATPKPPLSIPPMTRPPSPTPLTTRPPMTRPPMTSLPTTRPLPPRPPNIPVFPNKQKTPIDNSVSIRPTPKPQINPSHNTKGVESLALQMQQLKLDHAKAMKDKEVEIHFLRCTATDSSLATVNALIAKKQLKDWTLSKNLPDWEKMSPEEVEEEIRVRGNQHKLVYDPKNPPRISRYATGTTVVSREDYFRSLLGEMRQKTKGASIPSKRFEGAPPSPLPVGRPPNPAPDPLDVNHFIARGARPKEPVRKQKPFDTKAMNSTADSMLRPQKSPPSALPSSKKNKASRSAPAASATPFAPISSTVKSSDGRVIKVTVKAGENDPSKKPPPPATRKYDPVGDWTPADGCPDGCKAKIGNYDSLITHRTRCPNRRKPQK